MEYIIIILSIILLMFDFKYIKIYIERYSSQLIILKNKIIMFFKDWRNAVSFIIAWLITNGWGWVFMFLGRTLNIKWMKIAGDAYIAFLWIPGINEKAVTIPLAGLIRIIFFKRNERNETAVAVSERME